MILLVNSITICVLHCALGACGLGLGLRCILFFAHMYKRKSPNKIFSMTSSDDAIFFQSMTNTCTTQITYERHKNKKKKHLEEATTKAEILKYKRQP